MYSSMATPLSLLIPCSIVYQGRPLQHLHFIFPLHCYLHSFKEWYEQCIRTRSRCYCQYVRPWVMRKCLHSHKLFPTQLYILFLPHPTLFPYVLFQFLSELAMYYSSLINNPFFPIAETYLPVPSMLRLDPSYWPRNNEKWCKLMLRRASIILKVLKWSLCKLPGNRTCETDRYCFCWPLGFLESPL